MPVNAHPEFVHAEKSYHEAQTPEEQLKALETMISFMPSHKGGENLRAQLKTRYKKLKEQIQKSKKHGKSTQIGIKKHDMQGVLIGHTNSGKSSLLKILTNAKTIISKNKFQTIEPIIGMLNYKSTQIQLIENPSVESNYYDKGLTNTADTLLILITNLEEIEKIMPLLKKAHAKKIIVFNKIETLDKNQKRKIKANLQSKKYNFCLISTITLEGLDELKEKLFESFDNLRIYTKEPGKARSPKPVIMKPDSNVKDVAEKILKGFSTKIKQTKIWGPSSKFPGQIIGLNHKLKDLDTVEFKTK